MRIMLYYGIRDRTALDVEPDNIPKEIRFIASTKPILPGQREVQITYHRYALHEFSSNGRKTYQYHHVGTTDEETVPLPGASPEFPEIRDDSGSSPDFSDIVEQRRGPGRPRKSPMPA
jgi:hypothetical protein